MLSLFSQNQVWIKFLANYFAIQDLFNIPEVRKMETLINYIDNDVLVQHSDQT